jgi:cysteinylglycine-S-conjugate dipeptidase
MTPDGAPTVPTTDSSGTGETLQQLVQSGLPSAIADLSRLVRIPSVAWDGFDFVHVQTSAEAVKELLSALDVFDSVDIRRAPITVKGERAPSASGEEQLGQPAVLATRAARNGRPTILLYAHHDVQPQGNDQDWLSLPFEPTVRGERLYGRGTADDKAGIMVHVAAIRAITRLLGTDFDLGLVVFIEGEEEFGSRSFTQFLAKYRTDLAADVIVVADSGNWDVATPALTVALRGNVTFRLTVSTLGHASHSGSFGGAVPDAMMAMVKLLATFTADDGSVAIAGLTEHEAETPPYDERQLRAESALLDGVSPIGQGSILNRIWYGPSVTVTGIDAPSVINASNTLAPTITVRVSVRIAPGQSSRDALAAVETHIHENVPFGARVEISDVDKGSPFLADTSGWAVADAKHAMAEAWGVEAVEMGAGGSIPFIADLVEMFPDAQILVTGVEDPDTRAHSPNESLHLGVFHRAILTEALLLTKFNDRA